MRPNPSPTIPSPNRSLIPSRAIPSPSSSRASQSRHAPTHCRASRIRFSRSRHETMRYRFGYSLQSRQRGRNPRTNASCRPQRPRATPSACSIVLPLRWNGPVHFRLRCEPRSRPIRTDANLVKCSGCRRCVLPTTMDARHSSARPQIRRACLDNRHRLQKNHRDIHHRKTLRCAPRRRSRRHGIRRRGILHHRRPRGRPHVAQRLELTRRPNRKK